MKPFTYTSAAVAISFGSSAVERIGDLVVQCGGSRVFLFGSNIHREVITHIAARLGSTLVGLSFAAVMHTPVDVSEQQTDAVRESGADLLVALGGGSTIGLAKAVALRTGIPIIAIPTTYAGSEATSILGQSENGRKTTIRDPKVRPAAIIYDVDLTLEMPTNLSGVSGLNAIAHAVEATYSREANPITTSLALQGIEALAKSLPTIARAPQDRDARSDALFGAWACGTCLDQVGMALHHKLCHTLGGSFNLPHAETHAVILPHAAAYNAPAVPQMMGKVATKLGGSDVGVALFDLARKVGAPSSLAELGMPSAQLDEAADIAISSPYWNPRSFDRADLRSLLDDAWHGRQPRNQDVN